MFAMHTRALYIQQESGYSLPCKQIVFFFGAECRNHARDLIKEYDLSSVDGIVIASGDGLLYEVNDQRVCVYCSQSL